MSQEKQSWLPRTMLIASAMAPIVGLGTALSVDGLSGQGRLIAGIGVATLLLLGGVIAGALLNAAGVPRPRD